jgi:hypothetical protein
MIEGLELLLNNKDQVGVIELRAVLHELLGKNAEGRFLSEEKLLRSRVFRLRFELDNSARSFVVKRLTPSLSQLERTVVERWLPQAGFHGNAPPLIGTAAEKAGKCIWHIYEDIGDSSLPNYIQNERIVSEAIDLIAKVHTSFAGHIFLGECRMFGGNYNVNFYSSCVLEAMRTLGHVKKAAKETCPSCLSVIDSLLQRLSQVFDGRAEREELMTQYYGMETMVHGDLWTNNFLVQHKETGVRMLLIDWDHVGAGPVHYDLSTLLLRFPKQDRPTVLNRYRDAVAPMNWQLPSTEILNVLFETAEYARLANAVIWPAVAAGISQAAWAFEDLREIDGWFNDMETVLPKGDAC